MSFFQKSIAGGRRSSVRKKSAELQRAPATHLGTGTLALGFLAKGRNRPKLCQFYLYFPFLPPQTPQIYSLLSLFAFSNPANLFITFPFCLTKPRKFVHFLPIFHTLGTSHTLKSQLICQKKISYTNIEHCVTTLLHFSNAAVVSLEGCYGIVSGL